MNSLNKIRADIEKFESENNQEMEFLFQSLRHSLKTALKQARNLNFERCTPSTKHSINLSRLLYRNLSSVPVPSIISHLDDLFAYIEETLQSNLKLSLTEDFEELIVLIEELEKGVKTLLKPIETIRPNSNGCIDNSPANSLKQTDHHKHLAKSFLHS
tara:strand:+ start:64 stop:537 length:474 start_codon:yes stop_codon:yes gene_type:complete